MELGIQNQVALITGGGSGLGRQAALSLAREGVHVAILGRTMTTLNKTVEELRALGVRACGEAVDISQIEKLSETHASVVRTLGPIDILVNNVGGTRSKGDICETTLEQFRATFDLNLFAAFQLIKLVLPHMRTRRWGRIINISSIWGREFGGNISYMTSKAAVIAA